MNGDRPHETFADVVPNGVDELHRLLNFYLELQFCMCSHPNLGQQIVPAPITSISLAINVQRYRRKRERKCEASPNIEHFTWTFPRRPIVHEVGVAEE